MQRAVKLLLAGSIVAALLFVGLGCKKKKQEQKPSQVLPPTAVRLA